MTFAARRGTLWAENVPLERIAATVGTPTYVYSSASLTDAYQRLDGALGETPHRICYSVKACSSLGVLHHFARLGAGFDIVSGGELQRVLRARGEASRVVFSGVGKTEDEMAAAVRAQVAMFNIESSEELSALDRVGRRLKAKAPFAVRLNLDIDAGTHRHVTTGLSSSKFGVPLAEARELYRRSRRMKGVQAIGVDCHIGSQITQLAPLRAAFAPTAALYRWLLGEGHRMRFLDLGGGLGVRYLEESPPSLEAYAKVATEAARGLSGATVIVEPGRALVAQAGVLLCRVLYRKQAGRKRLLVVDAGLNDLMRPALYEAHHEVWPVRAPKGKRQVFDVVGPVCESADVLAQGRRLPELKPGALLAIATAGAYGMSMASQYNSRPRPAEVLVEGALHRTIREREALADLWRGERL